MMQLVSLSENFWRPISDYQVKRDDFLSSRRRIAGDYIDESLKQ